MIVYDVVIIGAGPAGLTSGLYAVRAGMKALVLEKAASGGQMLSTDIIENFPGFPEGIKGQTLAEKFKAQALKAGVKIVAQEAKEITLIKPSQPLKGYTVKTEDRAYSTYSIILACGAYPKRLGLPGEKELTSRGVSYCATCDGPLFREQEIIVVGAGNAAAEEALYLSGFARKVTLVHRRAQLRADKVFQDRLRANSKIGFVWNSRVVEILGKGRVSGVKLEDVNTGKRKDISCAGVFVFVGFKPDTDFIQGIIETDEQGFIVTDEGLQTSRQGIFACGDCRLRALRQVITASSEGAQAAWACRNYLDRLKGTTYA